TMKRKKPSFNETYHGYRTFSELLEDAQHEGLLELETDKRSRTYVVTRFGSEMQHDGEPVAPAAPAPAPRMPLPAPVPRESGGGGGPGQPTAGKEMARRRRA